ncbi:MAG: VacJ family lipoprotein [Oligoflexia bacterium]|nr:VacJ family lipoprotein [Oligoflexia bacterium]
MKPSLLSLLLSCVLMPLVVLAEDQSLGRESGEDLHVSDPLEGFNRGIFWFNDHLDVYLVEPIARRYDKYVPEQAKDSVGNFFNNLRYPSYLVSDLVQLRFGEAAKDTGRFLVNSTLGVAGLFDVANEIGWKEKEKDFALALASHDVGPGAYIVLPILGPSNVRDAFGKGVDFFLSPWTYLRYTSLSDEHAAYVALGARSIDLLDQRASLLEAVDAGKSSSLDYYLFVQSAYYQHRNGMLAKMSSEGEVQDQKHVPTDEELLNDELQVDPAR